ncbi:MAG: Zeta toxin family protein [Dehalococcoidia bacterium]|nr:Zeta toxin family protein [Dehalococcoidia bacterium]
METEKKILIIAGPNGAGKTLFATQFLPNEANCATFINADLIAAGLSPFQPELAAVGAGRLMLGMMRDYVKRGESFAFETTLSGRGYVRSIPYWQEQGYRVELFFLRLRTPEMAIQRVKQRVLEGGHDVPEPVIRRRFEAGWRNFQTVYRDLVDDWRIYDNSTEAPVLIWRGNIDE